jgi:hypothetical protein
MRAQCPSSLQHAITEFRFGMIAPNQPYQRTRPMPFELTLGLLVVDREEYAQSRAEIAPLLEARGRFRYDFEVARSLKREAGQDINRLFVIPFLDRASRERFFTDSQYVEIRARLRERSGRR